jgi:Ser/Thr protein kinase RdoA (MazF antagonist)
LNAAPPYADLNPSLILTAIENLGLACSGSLFALNSYENRVYQVGMDESPPLITKFYRPNRWSDAAILEEHQFALELQEQEIPVIAPIIVAGKTLHEFQGYRFALFKRQGGRTLELDNLEHLEWMGRFIGRLHAIGACKPFQNRLCLDVQTYGHRPYQFLLEADFIPAALKEDYCRIVETLLAKITESFERAGDIKQIRLHGDCHAGNVLWSDGPQIVDLDDCLMGPAVQDIWMLVSGDTAAEVNMQLDCILEGYNEFHDFNYRELHLIEALRALRMLHYSAWLARRWDDPAFPLAFPWFNTLAYWQEQLLDLQEQVDLLNP